MNVVVLTAVLSCLNSGLYTASRMLFVLSAREAPAGCCRSASGRADVGDPHVHGDGLRLRHRGVRLPGPGLPVPAQLLRRHHPVRLPADLPVPAAAAAATPPERLKVKMWLHPVLPLLTALAIVGVLVQMFIREGTRSQILLSLLAWGLVLVAYAVQRRTIGDAHLSEQASPPSQADRWMHEHGAAAELEVDAAVGEGPLDPALIRRAREEGYPNEGV